MKQAIVQSLENSLYYHNTSTVGGGVTNRSQRGISIQINQDLDVSPNRVKLQ